MIREDKIKAARELCESNSWEELLKFTRDWHTENPDDAKALFYRGIALATLGRFVEAETIYRLALQKEPTDFKIWNNLAGILLESLDRPMDAVHCMEEAMKLEPHNKLGWSNLASLIGQLGRHEKAIEFANRALTLDPQMVEAHLHKAAAAKALGKTEVVKEVCETLATIEAEKFRRSH
ncbi:MAG TPA: tetratricopeptide repeat protein [Candidatus Baltobacteraceae bacterium]|nr:tetratricopeptide repeat protein [Candidatus Baltobacteraceae bacterium]